MLYQSYKSQVHLLLKILPELAKETCFALHGGTALNLFVRDLPRLSVDVDLTYIPLEDRDASYFNINAALLRVKYNIENSESLINVIHNEIDAKLLISQQGIVVKVEVNTIKRGLFHPPVKLMLSHKTQNTFEAFCEMQVVDHAHLFGGKICAALDRQHPRDLFDVHFVLNNYDFTEEIIKGFIFYLISSNRPIVEILFPHLKDQRAVFENHFSGMTLEPFSYEDFEATRLLLIQRIQNSLSSKDKEFLLNIENATPDWNIYNFSDFPAVQWKLFNIEQLKMQNPEKHIQMVNLLKEELNI
jgi:predicted nucleotidyltransferase component of viral defense system